jgi:hypothetical protein
MNAGVGNKVIAFYYVLCLDARRVWDYSFPYSD